MFIHIFLQMRPGRWINLDTRLLIPGILAKVCHLIVDVVIGSSLNGKNRRSKMFTNQSTRSKNIYCYNERITWRETKCKVRMQVY